MTTGAAAFDAIVLAAGSGQRFGGGKLTSAWGDGLLIEGALAAAFASPARTVVVVWGADGRVLEAATRFAGRIGQPGRLRMAHAVDHAEGMAASLRAGIAALPRESAGAFVFLGDMPKVPHGMAARLASAVSGGAWAAAPLCDEQRGHPVLITSRLFPILKAQTGDQGAGKVLATLGKDLALVLTNEDGVLFDVDERPA